MRLSLRMATILGALLIGWASIAADDKKDDKKTTTAEQKKKDDAKAAADAKKKEDKKSATDDDKKKDDKKSTTSAKNPPTKEKMVTTQEFLARLSKVDDSTKLSMVVKEPYIKDDGKLGTRDKEVELPRAEEITVRVGQLPPKFDEKGRPLPLSKFSKKELEELKGPNKKAWGYNGDVDSLKPGQNVRVFMGKKKGAPKTEPPAIYMIYILTEPNP